MAQEQILEAINNLKEILQADIFTLRQDITLKNQELEQKIQNCETIQTKHDTRLSFLEKEYRKRNILVHGINEAIKGRDDLENFILDLLNIKMSVKTTLAEIDTIYRLGPKKEDKTRPVIIKFISTRKVFEILAQLKTLRNTDIYITEDLTKEEQEVRKKLVIEMKKHREQGKLAIIRNNKLLIKEKNGKEKSTNGMSEEGSRKRLPSDEVEYANTKIKMSKDNTNKEGQAKIINAFESLIQRNMSHNKEKLKNKKEPQQRPRSNSIATFLTMENTGKTEADMGETNLFRPTS